MVTVRYCIHRALWNELDGRLRITKITSKDELKQNIRRVRQSINVNYYFKVEYFPWKIVLEQRRKRNFQKLHIYVTIANTFAIHDFVSVVIKPFSLDFNQINTRNPRTYPMYTRIYIQNFKNIQKFCVYSHCKYIIFNFKYSCGPVIQRLMFATEWHP